MLMATESPVQSLYVHVPFCAKKCSYCAFYSESSSGELINRFVSALIRELEIVAPSLSPKTIFFGGGTPSILNLRQWELIFSAMESLGLMGAEEWTIESNPATVSVDKARLWRSAGVNRVSMGVQSLDESLLDRLGRIHNRKTVFKSFDTLRVAGFDNINVDLMFGIPGQTSQMWRETLKESLAMHSEHLSCYEVIYEEDTPLFEDYINGRANVDEDLICSMYEDLLEHTSRSGFAQYEVANFAQRLQKSSSPEPPMEFNGEPRCPELPEPYYACRHNINYWRGGSFHAVGPSAAGYVQGRRTRNISNTMVYCKHLENGDRAIEWSETLPPVRRAGEVAAFGLRMNSGWAFEDFQSRTGYKLQDEWRSDITELIQLGWAEQTSERFFLTHQGMRFADAAAQYFLR